MKQVKNEYQISKTLRFGLSQKNKTRKEGYEGEIYQSHQELSDLVKISEDRIKQSVSADQKTEMSLSVGNMRGCLGLITKFLSDWQKIYHRTDQIALSKDYYKILCKKIGFEGFWIDVNKNTQKKTKKPQSSVIALSELDKKDDRGMERKQYIIDYWQSNLRAAAEKYEVVNEKLAAFEEAIKINRSDNRPNEV